MGARPLRAGAGLPHLGGVEGVHLPLAEAAPPLPVTAVSVAGRLQVATAAPPLAVAHPLAIAAAGEIRERLGPLEGPLKSARMLEKRAHTHTHAHST
jgi:hypothetical protein